MYHHLCTQKLHIAKQFQPKKKKEIEDSEMSALSKLGKVIKNFVASLAARVVSLTCKIFLSKSSRSGHSL